MNPIEGEPWLKCPTCGYDLRGLPENRCPECGEPFNSAELASDYEFHRVFKALSKLALEYGAKVVVLLVLFLTLSASCPVVAADYFGLPFWQSGYVEAIPWVFLGAFQLSLVNLFLRFLKKLDSGKLPRKNIVTVFFAFAVASPLAFFLFFLLLFVLT